MDRSNENRYRLRHCDKATKRAASTFAMHQYPSAHNGPKTIESNRTKKEQSAPTFGPGSSSCPGAHASARRHPPPRPKCPRPTLWSAVLYSGVQSDWHPCGTLCHGQHYHYFEGRGKEGGGADHTGNTVTIRGQGQGGGCTHGEHRPGVLVGGLEGDAERLAGL
jgi:hypothetical protein